MDKKRERDSGDKVQKVRLSNGGYLGTVDMGIPSYDRASNTESLTPLKNRFSALHDRSMDEVLRTGAKTSAMENRARNMRSDD